MPDGEMRGRAETEQRLGVPGYAEDIKRRDSAELPEVRAFHALRRAWRWCRRRLGRRSTGG